MTIDDPAVLRSAGLSTILAIVALVVSGIAIGLFFGGAGAHWGPINDVATAVALLALLLPVVAVHRLAGPETGAWLDVVSVAAIAGILVAAVGQLLLVAGVIALGTSFVTGGLGILPVFAWLVAVAILALGPGILPAQVGWLAIGVLVLSAGLTVVAGAATGPGVWVVAAALIVVLAAWLGSLAATFLERGAGVA